MGGWRDGRARGTIWSAAVGGEEGGATGGGFFCFLREEGLRLRKRNGFRFFILFLGFFLCAALFFFEKLPPCEYFSSPVYIYIYIYMTGGLLI